MILGSDCVAYLDEDFVACAEPATFVRLADGRPIAVLCASHAAPGDQPIASTIERAPRSERLIELAAQCRARRRRNG